MKKRRIGIRELKNRTSRIVDEVRENEESYIVTKRGEPIAVLRPWSSEDERAERVKRAREVLSALEDLAEKVGHAAGRRSATTAVSAQRR